MQSIFVFGTETNISDDPYTEARFDTGAGFVKVVTEQPARLGPKKGLIGIGTYSYTHQGDLSAGKGSYQSYPPPAKPYPVRGANGKIYWKDPHPNG